MIRSALVALVFVSAFTLGAAPCLAHDQPADGDAPVPASAPKLENLLRTVLEGVDGTEVVVSRVTLPPHTTLPRHWHPGEEFAYVIEGSATLWQEGEEDILVEAGHVAKVPLRKVHTAITGDEGAVLIVFRVHAEGEPERVLVETK